MTKYTLQQREKLASYGMKENEINALIKMGRKQGKKKSTLIQRLNYYRHLAVISKLGNWKKAFQICAKNRKFNQSL